MTGVTIFSFANAWRATLAVPTRRFAVMWRHDMARLGGAMIRQP